MMQLRTLVGCVIWAVFVTVVLSAGEVEAVEAGVAAPNLSTEGARQQTVGPGCEDGVVKDDGTAETGYGWVPSVLEGVYVQEFQGSELPSRRLDSVCVCWMRSRDIDRVDFEVVIFRSAGDQPELTPSYVIPATATDIPVALDGAFTEVDLRDVPMDLGNGTSYIGVRWNPSIAQFIFVCADHSATTPQVNGYYIDDRAEEWASVLETRDPTFDGHRAMMIRVVQSQAGPPMIPDLAPWGGLGFATLLAMAAVAILVRRSSHADV